MKYVHSATDTPIIAFDHDAAQSLQMKDLPNWVRGNEGCPIRCNPTPYSRAGGIELPWEPHLNRIHQSDLLRVSYSGKTFKLSFRVVLRTALERCKV